MGLSKRFTGLLVGLLIAAPCSAETISFAEFEKSPKAYKTGDIHITPTGPDDLPVLVGGLEVLGAAAPFLNNSVTSRFYSGVAKLDETATKITFDVSRANNSGWYNPIKIIAFDQGKRVAVSKVDIAPLGESTQITITAPAIDKFAWGGNGWVYHPYVVRNLDVTFAAAVSAGSVGSVGNPAVGTTVPEPCTATLLGITGTVALLSRRRRNQPAAADTAV